MEGVNGQELSHRHELSNYVATHSGDDSPTGIIQAIMIRVFRGTCITWIQQSSVKFSGDGPVQALTSITTIILTTVTPP